MRNRGGIASVVILILSACATIPIWVKGPLSYEKNGYIYVVGYSSPTYDRKDAEIYAKENAIVELAKIIKVRIRHTVINRMKKTGRSAHTEEHFVSTTEQELDNILINAEPVAVWYDNTGKKGEAGSAFALYRIKKSFISGSDQDR